MKQGLFNEDEFRNENADESWKRSETDKMLDFYFAGSHPNRIAQAMGRNPKAVKRRIEQFRNNERDRAVKYEPYRRTSRKGARWTENEREFVRCHKQKGVPLKATAKVLQRDLSEFGLTKEQGERVQDMRRIGVGVDLVLAYRLLYYCHAISILPDEAYDSLEEEEMEFGAHGDILDKQIGSDNVEDYPPHIRSLALYLAFKYGKRKEGS